MSRQATLIGRKGKTWSSIAVGTASEMRQKFKRDPFPGYEQIYLLDTSGGHRRKKGSQAAPSKPKAKK